DAARVVGGGLAPADLNLAQSLIGHVFLFMIAVNSDFAMPPWPLFAVLFVLDLALFAAALHQRRGPLQIAAIAASAVVLFAWAGWVDAMPWSLVVIIVALALPIYAIVTTQVAARVPYVLRGFLVGIAVAGLGRQFIMMAAGGPNTPPAVVLLVVA